MKSKRFDKNNWIELGLQTLSKDGVDSLTVDQLCKNAEKTKGSFYFHFKTIDEYLDALTQYWAKTYTTKLASLPLPKTKRLDLLNQLATRLDLDLETGIRNLASRNKNLQAIITKADNARIKWLTQLYIKSEKYNEEEATALATIEIAAFTGFRLIAPELKPEEARDLYDKFLKLTNRA